MKLIQWCEEHQSSGRFGKDRCDWAWARLGQPKYLTVCCIVDRQLADPDDLVVKSAVVEAEANGPRTLVISVYEDGYDFLFPLAGKPTARPRIPEHL